MTAAMPLRVGTRGSPLALVQTRAFIDRLKSRVERVEEHIIRTTGDAVQDRRLAEIGGKGLFAKEIHEALGQGRIDLAVHSLKDLETTLPAGIVLGCTLEREDARDALILADPAAKIDPSDPFACLPAKAVIGTSSVRRQAQLLAARPDISITTLRGNVQTRLNKLADGVCTASLLAFAGLKRLGLADRASVVLDPEAMVPAAGQGIIGVTVRQDDHRLRDLLAAIEDASARVAATAERAMLLQLDGSCRTPIGAYARILPTGALHITGLVARPDGSFVVKRSVQGAVADAERIGCELGDSLRADSPRDVFD
jgi:hydroxymethylbilane synthase